MPRRIDELINQQVMKSEVAAHKAREAGLPPVKPVITISRSMGSGARIIAQKLSQDLGWSLWDKELLDAMADEASVSRKVVEEFDERSISDVNILIRDILGEHEMGGFLYPRHLIRAVLGIARLGNAIILGRGANFILPRALNVRIDAPEALRVQNMITYENLTKEQAIEKLHRSDKERAQFLKKVFGKEVSDGHCTYHLSLCMCAFTNDGAVEILKQAIKDKFGPALKKCEGH
ncbi:MAG TPA: cytidylate kinase-like family protein [Armatimonadota bacterium]